MIRDIEGRQNHSVKLARKLQKKKFRRERGLLVGEGLDLLSLAVEAGAEVGEVLVRRDILSHLPPLLLERARAGGVDVGICSEETLGYASSLGGSADVIFICRQPDWSLADVPLEDGLTLYLQKVGDPGNVGTLVRGAVGFGASGLVCSPATADPYSPKAMRAGMGAQFLLPVVIEVTPGDMRARLASLAAAGSRPPRILVADPYQGQDVREADPARAQGADEAETAQGTAAAGPQGVLVVLGSEREGAGEEWESEERVTIPQTRFDSLNVAMAGTILLYELTRRRTPAHPGPG